MTAQVIQLAADGILDDRYAPIATVPRDGTIVIVAHEDVGAFPMRWDATATNALFAPGQVGLWVVPDGSFTWSEHDGLGPSHWRAA